MKALHEREYMPEPAAALRRLAGLVRPGGPVALQEFNFTLASLQWYPAMPLWQRFWDWMQATVVQAGVEALMGYKLGARTARPACRRRSCAWSRRCWPATSRMVTPGRRSRCAACCR